MQFPKFDTATELSSSWCAIYSLDRTLFWNYICFSCQTLLGKIIKIDSVHVACRLIIIAVLSAPFFVLLPYKTFRASANAMSILSLILPLWYCASCKTNVNRLPISLFRRFTYLLQSLQSYFLPFSLRTLALSFFILLTRFLEFLLLCPFLHPLHPWECDTGWRRTCKTRGWISSLLCGTCLESSVAGIFAAYIR